MDIIKTDHSNGLSTWTFADGTIQIRCNDCNQWHHAGAGSIKHSKRCGTPRAQMAATPHTTQQPISQPRSANGLSNQEALDAVQRGYLTQDQAMNRDF